MAINSRQKGKAGELELSHILQGYGYDTRRGQQYCGANGDADVVGLPGVHIESKRVEHLNLDKAMAQAQADARADEIPVVMHRKNRQGWKVTMTLEDFMALYMRANGGDLISRQAAVEAARKCSVKEVTPDYMLIDKAEIMTELMMLPPANT